MGLCGLAAGGDLDFGGWNLGFATLGSRHRTSFVQFDVGLAGIKHDAVTVEGNDLCSLSAIIRHWHFFSVGWARVEAPPKVSGRKPER